MNMFTNNVDNYLMNFPIYVAFCNKILKCSRGQRWTYQRSNNKNFKYFKDSYNHQ